MQVATTTKTVKLTVAGVWSLVWVGVALYFAVNGIWGGLVCLMLGSWLLNTIHKAVTVRSRREGLGNRVYLAVLADNQARGLDDYRAARDAMVASTAAMREVRD